VSLYRDRGVVLRTHKLGEADRIITLLSEQHGKVRAVAKGIRKTKSRFGARLEPSSHVALQLYEGRELDIVTQAETIDHHAALREDFERLGRAVSMLEAADQLSLEREPNPQLYQMLVKALRTLAGHDGPLVVPAFFLKLLDLEGYRPQVDACVVCGDEGTLVAWAVSEGGLRCVAHRQGPSISPEAIGLLRDILGGRLGAALNAPRSPATAELDHLAVTALEHHLERRLRSIATLHRA
jgi:DNA repair protein RecO (recombination protein O)